MLVQLLLDTPNPRKNYGRYEGRKEARKPKNRLLLKCYKIQNIQNLLGEEMNIPIETEERSNGSQTQYEKDGDTYSKELSIKKFERKKRGRAELTDPVRYIQKLFGAEQGIPI